MKKFLTLALAVFMVISCFTVTTAAADGALKMGTPTIDGVLDDIYTGSVMIKGVGADASKNQLTSEWDGSMVCDIYLMYDNNYFYGFVHGVDDDLISRGRAYATSDKNPIVNDVFEFRLVFNGNDQDQFKASIDAYGYDLFGLPKHYEIMDYDTFVWAVKTDEAAGTFDIEIAIPCTKGNLDLIKYGTLGFAFQMNDIDYDGRVQEFSLYNTNQQNIWTTAKYTLSGQPAVAGQGQTVQAGPVTGTIAEVTTAAPEPDTTPAPETTPAPADTTEAPEADTTVAEADDTTAAEGEDTTAAEGEDTTAAEGEDTTAAGGEDTTAAEGEDTTAAEGEDTAEAEGEDDTTAAEDEVDTTAADDEETTAADDEETTVADEEETTADEGEDDKGGLPVGVIIAIVAAVVVIAGIAVALSKKKKN